MNDRSQSNSRTMPSMARLVSLAVVTVLIVFLGITFYNVIAPFLLPLFLAGVAAMLCQPLFAYFVRRTKGRVRLAAGLTTGTVFASVFIPLLVVTFIAAVQMISLAQSTIGSQTWRKTAATIRSELEIDQLVARIQPYFAGTSDPDQIQAELDANLKAGVKALAERTLGYAGAAAGAVPHAALGLMGIFVSALVGTLMFVIALYYFLADGPAMLAAAEKLIPVQVDYQRQLLTQFNTVVRAVVLATFLAALAQGLATAVAMYFAHSGHFMILFIVATLAALIPLAGTWLVWGPYAIWLAYQGSWGTAILLALFGAIVVGTLDNVIRTFLLNTDAKLHPLLAFVSVLGGLQVMGLWGVFVGPVVASCLHALIKIFNTELREFSRERFGPDRDADRSAASETPSAALLTPPGISEKSDGELPESQTPSAGVSQVASAGEQPG